MPGPRLMALTLFLALATVACGDSDAPEAVIGGSPQAAPVSPTANATAAGPDSLPSPGETILTAGILRLPAATAFGQPGFHEVVTANGVAPDDPAIADKQTLIFSLSDATRPDQTCGTQHPLSGCVTVDWSDAPTRPNVPGDGVFVNMVTLELESGRQTFYLTDRDGLAEEKNRFKPG